MQLQFQIFPNYFFMQLQFFLPELTLHKYSVEGYTPCEHGAVKAQGTHSDWDTLGPSRTRAIQNILVIRARLVAQVTKRTTSMDLTDTFMTFVATPPVEGFRVPSLKGYDGREKEESAG